MRKTTWIVLLVLIAAVSAPHAGPRRKKPETPVLKLTTVQTPTAGRSGEKLELQVTVAAPDGIKLNKYPGITLTVTESKGLELDSDVAFVGVKEMPDPEKNAFENVDPLVLSMVPEGSGGKKRYLKGSIKFFYCVKKTGFCAPGKQAVKIPVSVE